MPNSDALGLPLSGADAASARAYADALHALQCYRGDPVAVIEAALAAEPRFVMGHLLHAWLHMLGTEPAGVAVAAQSLARADALGGNERERAHAQALHLWLQGQWRSAARTLEDLTIEQPLDALALQAGHALDFYLGDARMLRDRITRALPAWSPSMPGYHALLGMQAFGLEETGSYARAEARGRTALELEPRDAWAHHAVAHVLEMQGRAREGLAWMRERERDWATDNFFAVHNWWHRALFHLDLNEADAALALYDDAVRANRSPLVLDLVDASALLWRLRLRSIDVGARWQEVADAWAPHASSGHYAFNDVHAAVAFVGAGREDVLRTLAAAQQRAMAGSGDNAAFTREVGAPLTEALQAFGAGEPARAVALLRPLRGIAHRFGGSHAQRDLIDLTLLEAAHESGQRALERALVAERLDAKPDSPAARALQRRLGR